MLDELELPEGLFSELELAEGILSEFVLVDVFSELELAEVLSELVLSEETASEVEEDCSLFSEVDVWLCCETGSDVGVSPLQPAIDKTSADTRIALRILFFIFVSPCKYFFSLSAQYQKFAAVAAFHKQQKIYNKLPFMRILNIQFIITYSKINYNRFRINFIGEFNMELNYALIGIRIKKIRKAQKITQDKLSEMAGISPQHLSQIESAKTKLSLPALISICNALNVTTDKILCDVLTAETTNEISADIEEVFRDCTADEVYLMLSVAESVKHSLRIKKIKLNRD